MSSSKKLILFTSEFPYGIGEQFIETEIAILASSFSEVFIYPLKISGERRFIPSNVKVIEPKLYSSYKRLSVLFRFFPTIFSVYLVTFIRSKNRIHYIKDFNRWFNFLLNRINDSVWLENEIDRIRDSNTVIYSYWFNLWAGILSLIKKRKKDNFQFFTRIHGGDFDETRKKDGYFPFREFELTQVKHVYAVSEFGMRHMTHTYNNINFNISLSRLGVTDHGNNPLDFSKGFYRIVSCSFIYGLKRVHLIADILSSIKGVEIVWTHFGSGELEDEVIKYAKNKLGVNVKIDFRGLVPNKSVINFYKTTPVDLFVNTSELEGIPVSMMEAISFGIPVVGCNICGVPEIVNDRTGILIPKIFDSKIVAKKIEELLLTADNDIIKRRNVVKEFWRDNFNGERNYRSFLNLISK